MKNEASRLGLPFFATACAEPVSLPRYRSALERGFGADMGWLVRHLPAKEDPRLLLPDARSVVVVGLPYGHERPAGGHLPETGRISSYAWGADYHDVLRARLRALLAALQAAVPLAKGRVFVDSGPVAERFWAMRSGLGAVGWNSCLIPKGGSPLTFLGVLLLNVDLPPGEPADGPDVDCAACRACLRACPTGALVEPGVLDASRCLSYLTIEDRKPLSVSRAVLDGRLFGCDACLEACPVRKRGPSGDPAFAPRTPHLALRDVLSWTPDQARQTLAGTPIARALPDRLGEVARRLLDQT